MKLRVKYKTTRTIIEVDGDRTLEDVRDKVKHLLSDHDTAWAFSLNGIDEIDAPAGATLDTLGLVGGDLIHIIETSTNDEGHDLEEQLISMGFPKANIEKVTRSFGATNLNDALELLNMLDNPNGSKEGKEKMREITNEASSNKSIEGSTQKQESKPGCLSADSEMTAHSITSNQYESIAVIKPLFLCDGVTDSFTSFANQVKCETASDYFCLAVHSLMLETGLRSEVSSHSVDDTTSEVQNKSHSGASLPENWRNPEMGFYRLTYVYKSNPDANKCCLTATVTGNSIVVSGTLDRDDSDVVYQTKLNITDFVNKSQIKTGNVGEVMKNLNKLSHKIKENIANKLIDEIRNKLGLTHAVVGVQSLPDELKLRLVCYLTVESVCRLSQAGREWRDLCNDEEVWKRLLFREFHGRNLMGSTHKEAFKCMYRMRKEQRKQEEKIRTSRTPMRPEFEVPPDIMYPERHPMVPGIIGGRHDLYPTGGFQPGGFPIVPQFSPAGSSHPDILREHQPPNLRRPPPGARFDPYGPIPDDDDFHPVRRPNHPDTLHRPGFGRGSGFGGGFGFM